MTTPRDQTWQSMMSRCHNPNVNRYNYYGGRGVAACDRWRVGENGKSGRECFHEDMGSRQEGLTLDRWPDKDGNYAPGTCRWATWKEQANNERPPRPYRSRSYRFLDDGGVTLRRRK